MNRKILILFILLIIQFSILNSQDTWIKSYQPFGLGYYEVEDAIVCSDSGYAVNGWYEDEYEQYQWAMLMKTDSDGNLEWAAKDTVNGTFYAESHAIVETDDGDFLVASQTLAGPGTLTKFSSIGDIVWNEPDYNCWIKSMDNTDDDNIIVAGYSFIYHKPEIRKITQDGEELWSNTFSIEGYNDFGCFNSVKTSSDGGYILTGFVDSDITQYDILVMKTDADGDSLWARTYVDDGGEKGLSITEDNEGNIMCAGYNTALEANGFLWYLDLNGETIWIQDHNSINEDILVSVIFSETDFITITGDSYGWQNYTTIYSFDSSYGIIWDIDHLGRPAKGDKSIHTIDDGIIFVNYTGYGGSDDNYINLIKTDSTGQVVDVNDFTIPTTNNSLTCYPNPFNPIINFEIKFSNEQNQQNEQMKIEIFNVKGQQVDELNVSKQQTTVSWNAEKHASGIYFVNLKQKNKIIQNKKITLLK